MAELADPTELAERIGSIVDGWLADPEVPVESTEWVDGKLAVRISQACRDATTVWIEVGSRTISLEAYFLPAPPYRPADAHRQLLVRNNRTRFVHFSVDPDGEIYVRSRLAVDWVGADTLQSVFAEISELIDVSFRPILDIGFTPISDREKLP